MLQFILIELQDLVL